MTNENILILAALAFYLVVYGAVLVIMAVKLVPWWRVVDLIRRAHNRYYKFALFLAWLHNNVFVYWMRFKHWYVKQHVKRFLAESDLHYVRAEMDNRCRFYSVGYDRSNGTFRPVWRYRIYNPSYYLS